MQHLDAGSCCLVDLQPETFVLDPDRRTMSLSVRDIRTLVARGHRLLPRLAQQRGKEHVGATCIQQLQRSIRQTVVRV
jgi:hypothetical protein